MRLIEAEAELLHKEEKGVVVRGAWRQRRLTLLIKQKGR